MLLTPLVEVKPKAVAKRAVFTAYDEALRLHKVTRYKNVLAPKIELTGKTAWDMLDKLQERKDQLPREE